MSDRTSSEQTDGADDATIEYQFDPAAESGTEAVVSAVAEAAGVAPTDLPPIFTVIDPDALDTLLDQDVGVEMLRLSFSYADYEVVIWDGTVTVHRTGA